MKHSFFSGDGNWYKGNLHAHTTESDGMQTPEERVKAYRSKGYSFLAITDHNVFASYPEFCGTDFIVLPATERDIPDLSKPHAFIHAVGLSEQEIGLKTKEQLISYAKVQPDKDWQQLLDEMRQSGQLVIIAHPVWSRMTVEQLLSLQGYIGIEIYNTDCDRGCYTGKSDYIIDCCLRAGKRALLFASDDCHGITGDLFGGWIMVKAQELTHNEIIKQIQSGNFYASTGPEIYDFGMDDENNLYIECSPCESINFIAYETLGSSIVKTGVTEGVYPLKGTETFVRCECVDRYGKIAYTNPVFLNQP